MPIPIKAADEIYPIDIQNICNYPWKILKNTPAPHGVLIWNAKTVCNESYRVVPSRTNSYRVVSSRTESYRVVSSRGSESYQ